MLQQEHFFDCPCCGAEISMILDITDRPLRYIEDCEVCCNPIEVSYEMDDENLTYFDAASLEQ